MTKTVTNRMRRVLSHEERYAAAVRTGSNFPPPRWLTKEELWIFEQGTRNYNREERREMLAAYKDKERFG